MRIASSLASFVDQLVPITVDQYEIMMRSGIIMEGAPIELLDGLLVRKDRSKAGDDVMTIGNDHVFGVESLRNLNERILPYGLHIRTQQPIQIPPTNEPEPDASIILGTISDYRVRKPQPEDVCCVVEVADSSLNFDRTTKMAIYASAAIPQYVIVNLIDHVVEVYECPDSEHGSYQRKAIKERNDIVELHMNDDRRLTIKVSEILP